MDVKVGDQVLFGQYAGQAVKVDGEDLIMMKEEGYFIFHSSTALCINTQTVTYYYMLLFSV